MWYLSFMQKKVFSIQSFLDVLQVKFVLLYCFYGAFERNFMVKKKNIS